MNIGIIGLGLIGGSMARAIIKNTSHTVYAYDISHDTMQKGRLLNAYHHQLNEDNYGDLDVLIIALNPRSFATTLDTVAPKLKNGTLVMDIGGNKTQVVDAMRDLSKRYPCLNFVATHPMAGREFWGINHSTALLFEKSSVLMIPVKAEMPVLVPAKRLLQDMGFAHVKMTTGKEHDKMIAYTSQLPHIISSSYIKNPLAPFHDGFSAGSFKDMSRVAKLNAGMWAELMIDNGENLIQQLDDFMSKLLEYKDAIVAKDEEKLYLLLESGTQAKTEIDKTTREWIRNL